MCVHEQQEKEPGAKESQRLLILYFHGYDLCVNYT